MSDLNPAHRVPGKRCRIASCATLLAACILLNIGSATAQEPTEELHYESASVWIEERYLERIGLELPTPLPNAEMPSEEFAECRFTCDPVVPRQAILEFCWGENALPAEFSGVAEAAEAAPSVRIDLSGTARGFEQGDYATIRLRDVPMLDNAARGMPTLSTRLDVPGQRLLNLVRAGRIVERPVSLPIFASPRAMSESLQSLPDDVRAVIEEDRMRGMLAQVRVLGRTTEMSRGVAQDVVSMVGLQPGMVYRARLVAEAADGARTIVHSLCRVPVCPADYTDMP